MVRTSRCIAVTLFKFGGPQTLPQATPSLCVATLDSVLRNTNIAESEKIFMPCREAAAGAWAHVQGREAAAPFAAAA
jgi:hypothetical protein